MSAAAGAWWACSVAVLLLSFVAVLAHPLRRRRARSRADLPGVSAILPIKSLHDGFEEAQRSMFAQDYANLDIEIVAAESGSPAISAMQCIQEAFPAVFSRVTRSNCDRAASPKLNTMWPGIGQARNDIILTKDSNLRLEPGELHALIRHLGSDTGLVSTIPIATGPGSLAAWIEASIINCYHARVLMLADAAGIGFGLGKVMLFRRSDLMRAGGFECLAWALGEDKALADAMGRLGLRTVLADRVSHQILGARRLSEIWQRQLRWMVIWRVQLPAAFFAAILGSALPTAAAGAMAAALFGLPSVFIATGTLVLWFCLEFVLCLAKGWPVSLWSPVAFLAREILTPILWLRASTTSEVQWGGTVHKAVRQPGVPVPRCSDTGAAVARNSDR
jgi:ceramide glucosyltransferase